ncbi:MAG: hypothetical protein CFE34_19375 [Rhodobacteraceae bacterium PARR1]|nr:MAG: hypothetical protein CFE34_19375 [Rhodobacteraceae bacterium PARR1]
MIETLCALILAHALADFALQSRAMADGKRKPLLLLAHGSVVFLTALACTGVAHPALVALAVAHMAIDLVKTRTRGGFGAFLADQAAHGATLLAVALWVPDLWVQGLWADHAALPGLMALAAGTLIATRAGGFAIGLLMAPWADHIRLDGLPSGGRVIGLLERGLIFGMILGGMPEGIGFLIAAKSVLRFGTVKEEAKLSEYVIIGTLASFAWAMAAALATLALLSALPPLGIPAFPS